MGKKSKVKARATSNSKKIKIRYANKFSSQTLTRSELEKFSYNDQVEYLNPIIKSQHPQSRLVNGETALIGGWYSCVHCAKSSIFGDGYVSEDDI